MDEVWRDIQGFEGYYQVSSERRIKSVERTVIRRDGTPVHRKEVIRKLTIGKNGYYYVTLRKPGMLKNCLLHLLFANAFPELIQGEWFEGAEIDHIDTNPLNNNPSNLRWVDHKGQMNNPLTKNHISTSGMGREAPNKKWVIQLSKNNEILHFYPSLHQAQRETGISCKNIHSAINGKHRHKAAGGFIWKYAD